MKSNPHFLRSLESLAREKNRPQPSESELRRSFALLMQAKVMERQFAGAALLQGLKAEPDKFKRLEDAVRAIGLAAGRGHDEGRRIKLLGEDASLGAATATGEIVVPEIFDALAIGSAWGYMRPQPVNAQTGKFPVATTRPAAKFIVTEGAALEDDLATAGTSVLTATQLAGVLSTMTREWIEDAGQPLLDGFLQLAIDAINALLDGAFLAGDGTANDTYGGITGVYNTASIPVVTAAAGGTTLQGCTRADLVSVISAVEGSALQKQPRWFAHPALLGPLLAITDNAGRPVVQTALETGAEEEFSLIGFPLTLTAGGPSTNSAAQKVLCFGRPDAYAVGVTRDVEVMASAHKSFNTGGIQYRVLLRAGGTMRRVASWGVLKTASA